MAARTRRASGREAALNGPFLPRLHVLTDEALLDRSDFLDIAAALMARGGANLAFHLRGHGTSGTRLHTLATSLAQSAAATGAQLLINDRIDVALAVDAAGVQLGRRSIPVERARPLVGRRWIGYSAHAAEEAAAAWRSGTDFVVLGTIYRTPTHEQVEPGGAARVQETTRGVQVPVIAIGGVTPDRVAELLEAGAHGVAVIRGVWSAEDPLARLDEYLGALEAAHGRWE